MSIQSKVQQIVGLAMDISEAGIADVRLHLHGEVGTLDVLAYPIQESRSPSPALLINAYCDIDAKSPHAENELDAVIAQLNELKAQKELAA